MLFSNCSLLIQSLHNLSPFSPNAPPQNVNNTNTSSTTITVEWDGVECLQRNTRITGYTVHYDPPSSDGKNEVTADGNGFTGGSVTLTGLSPLTNYSIQVAADSGLGRGPFSIAITVATPEAREFCMIVYCLLLPRQLPFSFPQYQDL